MEKLVSGITLVTTRKDSRRVIILSTIFLLILLLATENVKESGNTLTAGMIILAVLGSFLAGINLSFAYTYMNLRRGTLWSVFNWNIRSFVALMKTGGEMYGMAAFSTLLGFLGFSAMLSFIPGEAEEVGHVGLIILLIATFALARKMEHPVV